MNGLRMSLILTIKTNSTATSIDHQMSTNGYRMSDETNGIKRLYPAQTPT
jgi:hypothetical protein